MKNITYILLLIFTIHTNAQIGVYTTSPQSSLDILAKNEATPASDEGVLIPRLTSFPVIKPGTEQNSMLVYIDNTSVPFGEGFYYWDGVPKKWRKIGKSLWGAGTNAATDPLIHSLNVGAQSIAVKDDGFVGFGSDNPNSELHISSDRIKALPGVLPELIVENSIDDVEVQLRPGGIGSSSYTIAAKSNTTDGLNIYENTQEEIQLKSGGDFRVDNLETAQNIGIVYPAALYAESDGTVQVKTPYSRLDDLKVNEKNFSSLEMCETITPYEEVFSISFYTYTTTPTQDVLLEISYHVGASITAFGGGIPDDHDTRHNSKIYGVVLRVNGVDFTTMTERMISNEGLNGYFHMSDHIFIPLTADGTTYIITLHGLVQNDVDTDAGIRGEFGGNPDDRIQILEKL
ncbi:MAG: hypothetical protein COA88_07635 [Kordia sp.]|nr:MAG: hypothetical protein COA88_07635 [Kordia sp.]